MENSTTNKTTGKGLQIDGAIDIISFLISGYGFGANSILVHHLCSSASSWFHEYRPYVIGILTANALSSLTHICLSFLSLGQKFDFVTDKLNLEPVNALSSIATAISTFYVAAITIRSFYLIRRCYHSSGKISDGKSIWSHLIHLAWPLGMALSLFGLNADHSAIWFELPHLLSDITFYVAVTGFQLIILALLFRTRRYTMKVNDQFITSRAQHPLQARVSLKRTVKCIRILIPQLTINTVLWLILLTANFIAYTTADERGVDVTNANELDVIPIWASFMDCVEAATYAIWPLLLTRNASMPLKSQIMNAILCQYDVKAQDAIAIRHPTAPATNGISTSGVHWNAIDSMWSRIEKTKGLAREKQPPDNYKRRLQ